MLINIWLCLIFVVFPYLVFVKTSLYCGSIQRRNVKIKNRPKSDSLENKPAYMKGRDLHYMNINAEMLIDPCERQSL